MTVVGDFVHKGRREVSQVPEPSWFHWIHLFLPFAEQNVNPLIWQNWGRLQRILGCKICHYLAWLSLLTHLAEVTKGI